MSTNSDTTTARAHITQIANKASGMNMGTSQCPETYNGSRPRNPKGRARETQLPDRDRHIDLRQNGTGVRE
jgi:hypothetical protein